MSDISKYIPKESLTVKQIFEEYKKAGDAEPTRGYLGASIIGHPCERYLWYCFRQCCSPDFSGRMYRLFETGDREEGRMAANLRSIGCEVHDFVPSPEDYSGGYPRGLIRIEKQFEVSALGGHFSGHMDGCALGIPEAPKTWHVLEFKTHKAKSFKKLEKEGVQKSKPQHFSQMQIYMHLTKMTRALYLAVNKDTDDLCSERIKHDSGACETLMSKAERIITSNEPPKRAFSRRDYYECKWCDAQSICWGPESSEPALPIKTLSCRQCCHATPDIHSEGANWHCEKLGVPVKDLEPCEHHLCLPGLFSFASPDDFRNDERGEYIVFKNEDGATWEHGEGFNCYSSEELMKLRVKDLTGGIVAKTKELFDAEITQCEEDILSCYPKEDCETVWEGREKNLSEAWRAAFNEDLMSLEMINSSSFPDYKVAELPGGRVAIVWCSGRAEIRKGKE
ncbi:MAG TPA: hypothetical protein ENH65_03945 [Candidatus Aminicenantes bacterium]|nr:hypothetical protein [Candidatus Aminicenantes bacterium]